MLRLLGLNKMFKCLNYRILVEGVGAMGNERQAICRLSLSFRLASSDISNSVHPYKEPAIGCVLTAQQVYITVN